MSCLEVNDMVLSVFRDIYYDAPEHVGPHVVTISEPGRSDELEISTKLVERQLNNGIIRQRSGPDIIDGIYWTTSPDDETLLIMIDDCKGNVHLISNDCLYIQYAMANYAFRNRQHFHEYHGECDIEHFSVSYDADSATEKCYFDTFIEDMELFYLLKEKGIRLF